MVEENVLFYFKVKFFEEINQKKKLNCMGFTVLINKIQRNYGFRNMKGRTD